MADTVFRTKAEQATEEVLPEGKTPSLTPVDDGIEVPYLDRQTPFSVEYFDLGEHWNDPEGGYETEVGVIEDYLADQIKRGELANTVKAVQSKLKELEKINNLKDEERTVIKIGTLASYVKFLRETDGIKSNYRKYGNY